MYKKIEVIIIKILNKKTLKNKKTPLLDYFSTMNNFSF